MYCCLPPKGKEKGRERKEVAQCLAQPVNESGCARRQTWSCVGAGIGESQITQQVITNVHMYMYI